MRVTSACLNSVWGRLLLLLALTLSAAPTSFARLKPVHHHRRIYIPKMLPTILPDAREGFQTVLRGRASWYGKYFQGRKTSSGERYDRFQYTCAHKKLPFGTRLRVTNVENGVTVVVRVSDRGPFRRERILDLSEKAAIPLGITEAGQSSVIAVVVPADTPLGLTDTPADLTALRAADPRPSAPFTAYLTPQREPAEANVVATTVLASPTGPLLQPATQAYEVRAGLFADAQLAQAQLARIQLLDGQLTGSVQQLTVSQNPMHQVVISGISNWLAAETVRRNLQAWGIAGQIHAFMPSPGSSPEAIVTAFR